MLLANVILWTKVSPLLYENYEVLQGKRPPGPDVLERYGYFLRCFAPFITLFYTSLWAVKLSLLLFFRRLGNQIRSHEIWWWCVTFFTVSGWLICIADLAWPCSVRSIEWITGKLFAPQGCRIWLTLSISELWNRVRNQISVYNVLRQLRFGCIVGLLEYVDTHPLYVTFLADLQAVISIPVLILWNTRVPLRKRIVLSGIFSATIVVMVLSVIRGTVVKTERQNAEMAWLIFWSYIENGIGTPLLL
jgi:hypothetical protein